MAKDAKSYTCNHIAGRARTKFRTRWRPGPLHLQKASEADLDAASKY